MRVATSAWAVCEFAAGALRAPRMRRPHPAFATKRHQRRVRRAGTAPSRVSDHIPQSVGQTSVPEHRAGADVPRPARPGRTFVALVCLDAVRARPRGFQPCPAPTPGRPRAMPVPRPDAFALGMRVALHRSALAAEPPRGAGPCPCRSPSMRPAGHGARLSRSRPARLPQRSRSAGAPTRSRWVAPASPLLGRRAVRRPQRKSRTRASAAASAATTAALR